ncbi:hypothetical protein Pcinc_035667 [Petrolisthes cinctipes]|uniref:Protein Wnt n=1 Tax=Petrolisthes cinctipes TaxID=88211 RepID=A0AAE1EPA1_PETCI|nr:hypothetical protein Pcinc_035667 [Petrolisthes cinctipes]
MSPFPPLHRSQGHRPVMDHSRICRRRGRRYARDPQSEICRHKPQLVPVILEGAQKAMKECQSQFSGHRWNCTDNRRSLKRILMRDTPESAYLNSIVSAGVTHQVTTACSRGDIEHCACSRNSKGSINYEIRMKKSKSKKGNRERDRRRQQTRVDGRRRSRKGKGRGRGRGRGAASEASSEGRRWDRGRGLTQGETLDNTPPHSMGPRSRHQQHHVDQTVRGTTAEGVEAEGMATKREGGRGGRGGGGGNGENTARRNTETRDRERRHGMEAGEETRGGGAVGGAGEGGVGVPGDAGVMTQTHQGGHGSDWHWRGCDDNVRFGYRVARDFVDGRYLVARATRDIKSQVLLWNNEAGRRAVRKRLVTHCKCHGLTGSCTHKTCWQRLAPFTKVASHLTHKFSSAVKVLPSNDGGTIIPAGQRNRSPRKLDLVYLEDSPDFCSANKRTGSLGTQGRLCNMTSASLDNCATLCCDRGYTQTVHLVRESCRCRFRYCCEVTCDTCQTRRTVSHCR